MSRHCLLVELVDRGVAATWQDRTRRHQYGMSVSFASSLDEAEAMLDSGNVLVMIVFADEFTADLQRLVRSFHSNVGCIPEFLGIVCDDPHPRFLVAVHELGIDQFLSNEDWPEEAAAIARMAATKVSDQSTPEAKAVNLSRSIRSADQAAIQKAKAELEEACDWDFRAAYALGKAAEAMGEYKDAILYYGKAGKMNTMFRPSTSSEGEALMVIGDVDKALDLLQDMERANPFDSDRKAAIASAYLEKGDIETANEYVEAAAAISAEDPRLLEARAQVLLYKGRVAEAFQLMDRMTEVGPFFASKLNELGIRLSQAGKVKSALALYQKAHKIVRPEMRYKISMNSALACRKLKAWDMALKYLARCEKEYGGPYDKLVKVRKALEAERAKAAAEKRQAG